MRRQTPPSRVDDWGERRLLRAPALGACTKKIVNLSLAACPVGQIRRNAPQVRRYCNRLGKTVVALAKSSRLNFDNSLMLVHAGCGCSASAPAFSPDQLKIP